MTAGSITERRRSVPVPTLPTDLSVQATRFLLVALGVTAAVTAVGIHLWLFADGSINNDDAVYRAQAEALTSGRLFIEEPALSTAYRPWFWTPGADGYVAKYLPLVGALLAPSFLLTGGPLLALAVFAAAVPVLTYALARALRPVGAVGRWSIGSRASAVTAAALLAGSPLVVVQSGTELSYVPAAVLLLGFLAALLHGLRFEGGRLRRGALLAVSGVALSALAASRPYDAVLLAAPPLVWGLFVLRDRPRRARLVAAAAFVAGGLPVTFAVLGYNALATGSPLRLPFALFEPADRLGYGPRRMLLEAHLHEFGVLDGFRGIGMHLLGVPGWTAGGALLLVLAASRARRWWRAGRPVTPQVALGATTVTLVAGYTVFWGPWLASVAWSGTDWIGPMYMLPVLVPLVVLTAPSLLRALARHPRRTRAALAGALALSGWQCGVALATNAVFAAQTQEVRQALAGLPPDALVLTATEAPYLGHPVTLVRNPVDAPEQRFAVARGPGDVETIRAAGPGRPVYVLSLPRGYYRNTGAAPLALTRSEAVRGETLQLTVDVDHGPPPRSRRPLRRYLLVEHAGVLVRCPEATAGRTTVRLGLSAAGLRGCTPAAAPEGWLDEENTSRRCTGTDCVAVALLAVDDGRRRHDDDPGDQVLAHRRLPLRIVDGRLDLLADGDVLARQGVDVPVVRAEPAPTSPVTPAGE